MSDLEHHETVTIRVARSDEHAELYARIGFVEVPELDWWPAPDVHLRAFSFDLSGLDLSGHDLDVRDERA